MPKRVKGLAATKVFRSIQASTWWCRNCDVPLLRMYCDKCGDRGKKLKLTPPGDVRPMFGQERDELVKVVASTYGKEMIRALGLDKGVVLLNRIQGVDAAYEVVAHGSSVGVWYFDIAELRWKFRPSYVGAKIAIDMRIPPYAIFDSELREGMVVPINEARSAELVDGCEWVSLGLGDAYGLGKVRGDKVIVVKVWRTPESGTLSNVRNASFEDVLEANKRALELLENEAVEFLRKVLGLRSMQTVVSLSGGKDSVVAAYLSTLAGVTNKAIFVDTGLELTSTYRVVDEMSKIIEVETVKSPHDFWSLVKVLDIPARDYRWCCKVLKILPLNRWRDAMGSKGVATIVGQRRYESISRALAGRVTRSASRSEDIIVAPINDWTALAVHLYIALRRLPLNEAYLKGFDRVGCFMCPTSRLAELEYVKREYSDLWHRWLEVLEWKRKQAGLPKEWIVYGLWRWRYSVPGDVLNTLRKKIPISRIVERNVASEVLMSLSRKDGAMICIEISFKKVSSIDLDRLCRVLRVVSLQGTRNGSIVEVLGKKGRAKIREDGLVEACSSDAEWLVRFCRRIFAAIAMSSLCIGCNLCGDACRKKAISYGVPNERCSGCARCTAVCPVASTVSKDVEFLMKRMLGIRS